ncbi:MAG: hypothetical protein HY719_00370, partial [Planctomycetes bacterium]|nr:hypothetical protein [Planctomycetota bacterium]
FVPDATITAEGAVIVPPPEGMTFPQEGVCACPAESLPPGFTDAVPDAAPAGGGMVAFPMPEGMTPTPEGGVQFSEPVPPVYYAPFCPEAAITPDGGCVIAPPPEMTFDPAGGTFTIPAAQAPEFQAPFPPGSVIYPDGGYGFAPPEGFTMNPDGGMHMPAMEWAGPVPPMPPEFPAPVEYVTPADAFGDVPPPNPTGYVNDFIQPMFEGAPAGVNGEPAWGLTYNAADPAASAWTLPLPPESVNVAEGTITVPAEMVNATSFLPPEAMPNPDGSYTVNSWPISDLTDNGNGTITLGVDISTPS